jgi:thiol-disulfide isomerase/thioredoxin
MNFGHHNRIGRLDAADTIPNDQRHAELFVSAGMPMSNEISGEVMGLCRTSGDNGERSTAPTGFLMLSLVRISLAALLLALPASLLPARADDAAAASVVAAPSQVVAFESETQLNALAAAGTTVVFFFANWCPNCRATVTELNARWDDVRPGLTLVIADYDKEQALKQKFGITYQDTFVLLDKDGKGLEVWNSGGVDGLNAHTSL